jgi:PIN domain nuclease of toxin-antitoxin system
VRGYLLDTHTALWALERPEALSNAAREAVISGPNVLSVVSYWEVIIKSMKGNLDVGDPRAWWFEALDQLAASPLALRPEHVSAVFSLPPLHKDPFDRIMIAQAKVEGLSLISADTDIARHASKTLRIVR